MSSCVMCGSYIPDNQRSKTCSMCYGDVDHGRDNYYHDYMERQEREYREQQEQQWWEDER